MRSESEITDKIARLRSQIDATRWVLRSSPGMSFASRQDHHLLIDELSLQILTLRWTLGMTYGAADDEAAHD